MREIIIDGFAGGGGASEGIRMALGRGPDIAINHDEVAVAMHTANHPETEHYCQNIWKANPAEVVKGRKIGLAWFSPDCKHFSKAKGGKPVKRNIRDLAWVVVAWAKLPRRNRPRVIFVENVEEFVTWGPLAADGRPCPDRGGEYFSKWVRELRRLGYKVDWREIVAADKGSPTTRKRLFVIARNDGLPIVWPEHSHGKPDLLPVVAGKRKPWRTAAEIIDWSLPCPSIFDTSEEIMAKYGIRAIRPLAENTLARIARGVQRYVINAANPFIVPITHTGDARVHGLDEPLRTVTTAHRGEHALITPSVIKFNRGATGHDCRTPLHTITAAFSETHPGGAAPLGVLAPLLVKNYHGDKPHYPATEPTRTILTGQHHMLVAPMLCAHYGEGNGGLNRASRADEPVRTITCDPRHSVVAAFLAQHNTDMVGHDAGEPVSTIVGKGCTQAVVSAGLVNLKGSDRRWSQIDEPVPTQCAGGTHAGEVRAFLTKFHGMGGQWQDCADPLLTQDTRGRFGLVTVTIGGEPYVIVDIGMRMLTPRELFRAQGFPDSYVIDRRPDGTPITKTQQIRAVGNSVCPQVAEALVRANYVELEVSRDGVPEFALQAAE